MFSLRSSKDFLLILFSVCVLSSSINSQPTYDYHFCLDQSNETSNTYYQSNLAVLLDSLSSKASQNYSFYNESSNIGIYALFLCRGDVSSSTCQTCVSYAINACYAAPMLISLDRHRHCHCFSCIIPRIRLHQTKKICSLIYSQKCSESKIGWRISGPNCFLRYEKYFFTKPPQSQPVLVAPQPLLDDNGGKKTVIIAISTIASIAVVAALFGFWFYKYSGGRKHEEGRFSLANLL
ncbi:cysteine-rich receptor-like protein kinase 10 [Quercus suber]|uniref:Cysteine-rich receptor-like protein kinase 10 n=1 Tax=Quercus suber TaxID=58331 RepID=A0AAW0L6T3_QUESU